MKMILLFVFTVTVSALAQTNLNVSTKHFIVTTNYVTNPDFRRVNGQLYNTRHSTNWWTYVGNIYGVRNGVVVCEGGYRSMNPKPPPSKRPESRYGNINTEFFREIGNGRIAFTNFPNQNGVVVGQWIKVQAMRVGRFEYFTGTPDELWDCGTPNLVPVLVTNAPATDRSPAKTR